MLKDLESGFIKPEPALSDYVDSFWMIKNHSDTDKDIVIVPDGRVDLFFSYSATEPFNIMLMGLESAPTQTKFPRKTVMYAISFKPLAVEYLLHTSISDMVNKTRMMPDNFLGMSQSDLNDLDKFSRKASGKIKELPKQNIDNRKQQLFELIYSSKGAMTVKELSEQAYWSSRQINRYFNQQFGISLKAYCNIIRFRASFRHISEGKLFPEQNFTDQAHFIKEIKKLSGVKPKDLFKNENDRFLQFSALAKK